MDQLECQKIARVTREHLFPALHGPVEVAVDPTLNSSQMPALTIVCLPGQFFRAAHRRDHLVVNPRLHGLRQPSGLEQVAHHEVRMRVQHRIDFRNGIASERECALQRPLEAVNRRRVAVGHRHAPAVRCAS